MNKDIKELCTQESKINADNLLTDIFLLLKNNYVAKVHCNGEKITLDFLNGQHFEVFLKEV